MFCALSFVEFECIQLSIKEDGEQKTTIWSLTLLPPEVDTKFEENWNFRSSISHDYFLHDDFLYSYQC